MKIIEQTCGCKVASDPVVKLAVVKVPGEPVVKPGVSGTQSG